MALDQLCFKAKIFLGFELGVLSFRSEFGVYGFGVIRWSLETPLPKDPSSQIRLLKLLNLHSLVLMVR